MGNCAGRTSTCKYSSSSRCAPSRGSRGPHFPTFLGTLRRYDCHLPVSGGFACRSPPQYLACFPRSSSPRRARGLVEAPRPRQGLWSPGPPIRACGQGDRWLSQVPELPLSTQAPLSDPGGVLRTRQSAPRTAAFRSVETVGFPLRTPWRDILMSTTLHISGLNHAACILATPGSVRPLTGRHAGSLLIGWRGVNQVGFEPCGPHPLGNNNQFRGISPIPKVSGFPWRDHCNVQVRR